MNLPTLGIRIGIFLVWMSVTIASVNAAGPSKITPFRLLDQHDLTHTIDFPASQNRVIIIGDRNCVDQTKEWGSKLLSQIGNTVEYIPIVAMGDIPEWLGGWVKSAMKTQGRRDKLLDWQNKVCRTWGFEPQQPMVMIVSRDGTILSQIHGGYSPQKCALVVSAIATASVTVSDNVATIPSSDLVPINDDDMAPISPEQD